MNMESVISFTRHSRTGLRCFLLLWFLIGLTAGCSHQPWDIETYIQNLERPERDVDQQPAKVVEALNIMSGMVVADVGAGSGYFTRRFAKAVGETGHVLAIDIEPKMLEIDDDHPSIRFQRGFDLAPVIRMMFHVMIRVA